MVMLLRIIAIVCSATGQLDAGMTAAVGAVVVDEIRKLGR